MQNDCLVAQRLCQTSNKVSDLPTNENLQILLREHRLNWFAFVMELKLTLREFSSDDLNEALEEFTQFLSSSDVSAEEKKLIEHSRHVFLFAERQQTH